MTKTVLILGGSGKIGTHCTRTFQAAGWRVRQFDRATDDMTRAAMGADVIVNGLNPPNYHNWDQLIPQITAQVIAAAKASGATVIIPGNVYNFGQHTCAITEQTPQTPSARKGHIRVQMEQAYRAAGVQTIILRAGNFIDPDHNSDMMSMLILNKATKGRVTQLGDPDAIQPFAYLPDWAKAAQMLADKRDTLETFEDIPFAGHSFSASTLAAQLSVKLNRPMRLSKFPWWLMTLLAPFIEVIRELREMRYLNDMSHWLDAERLNTLLPGFEPTALDTVICAGLPRDIHPDQSMRSGQQTVAA